MFAPNHHAAMKHAAPVRKELGVRTLFNILGPLTNPANAPNQLLGVFHPDLVGILVRVLQRLGSDHVMVVYGMNGMDEISLSGETLVGELKDGEVREYTVHPSDFGLPVYDSRVLRVANKEESVQCIQRALANEDGPIRDVVLLNAGAALYCAGVASSVTDGVKRAREAVASGRAMAKLSQFVSVSNKFRSSRRMTPSRLKSCTPPRGADAAGVWGSSDRHPAAHRRRQARRGGRGKGTAQPGQPARRGRIRRGAARAARFRGCLAREAGCRAGRGDRRGEEGQSRARACCASISCRPRSPPATKPAAPPP